MKTFGRYVERTWRLISARRAPAKGQRATPTRHSDLGEALAATGLAADDARAWMLHVRRFCEEHGGERRYPELLDLARRALAELE
jgi:hypothetical protein